MVSGEEEFHVERISIHFFYTLDSVYTERYMLTPELNPDGYETSAVNNMTGFRNAKYLLAHGTGDDNGKK
jgi:dipeptidyl aminopeptidase/acylaminoacyl peptidase